MQFVQSMGFKKTILKIGIYNYHSEYGVLVQLTNFSYIFVAIFSTIWLWTQATTSMWWDVMMIINLDDPNI